MAKQSFYSVRKGREPGVYETWDECQAQVSGFQGAEYKKFNNMKDAIEFMVATPEQAPVQKEPEKSAPSMFISPSVANAKQVYGVQSGKKPGIYGTWAECQEQVSGFQGAKYKKFSSLDDALSFVKGEEVVKTQTAPQRSASTGLTKVEPDGPYAFVDGSFNAEKGKYGYGGFVCVNGRRYPLQGSGTDPEMASMRNVAGEIMGSMAAVKKAEELNIRELTILYDYKGIENWAKAPGEKDAWKATKAGTKAYQEFMKPENRRTQVVFQKVEAHTGIEGNEMADVLAKNSVGISLTPKEEKLLDRALASGRRDGFGDKFDSVLENTEEFSL